MILLLAGVVRVCLRPAGTLFCFVFGAFGHALIGDKLNQRCLPEDVLFNVQAISEAGANATSADIYASWYGLQEASFFGYDRNIYTVADEQDYRFEDIYNAHCGTCETCRSCNTWAEYVRQPRLHPLTPKSHTRAHYKHARKANAYCDHQLRRNRTRAPISSFPTSI